MTPSTPAATTPSRAPDASARRVAALIAHLNTAVLVEDERRHIALTNQLFCDYFHVPAPPEALVGADCSQAAEQSKGLFADPDAFVRRVDDILARREAVFGDRLAMADGRVLDRDYIPVWEGDEYLGHLWNYRDVTEQVRASDRVDDLRRFYEKILDVLPAQLAVFDPDGTYRYVNPAAVTDPELRQRIVGLDDIAYCMLRGRDVRIGEGRRQRVQRVAKTRASVAFEETIRLATGEDRHYARFITPVLDDAGRVEMLLGYGLDITDRRRAEEDLREAKTLAERSSKAKEQFLANMSHEIRTPLNAVIGTAHLLQSTPLDPLQQRYVDAIRYSADTLLAIINDILDLTKIGTGHIVFESVPFAVGSLVKSLGDAMRATAEHKGIVLETEVGSEVPDAMIGDPTRLNQILLNLVANAVKFTERGRVSLAVQLTESRGDRLQVEFRVRDTGIGISPDKVGAIFDVFTQERSDTTRRYGGTGLGLAIVRELVTLQGGTVRVESEVGRGSTFIVRLPFLRATAEDRAALQATGGRAADGEEDVRGMRLLLVEDNEMNQFVATQILTRAGALVEVEGDGRRALERLRRDARFDAVLMDIQMPEMDGFEATRIIRRELGLGSDVLPIIALTASALVEQRSRARALGMDDFVMKPFDPHDLRRRIVAAVRRTGRGAGAVHAEAGTGALDLDILERHTLGEADFALQMIGIFVANAPAQLELVRRAADRDDRAEVSQAAHKLRSAVGVVGAKAFAERLQLLDLQANALSADDLAMHVAWCEAEMPRVLAELDAVRHRYGARSDGARPTA